ncbi:type II secretion system protein M [Alkalilimnicola ehrlichii]|uniref:type II secretion system protein M n=1 Tax=Alkalilimnicola ehrlichii TaxID=351052 RepID=UPI003B9F7350
MKERLLAHWQGLEPRERRILLAGALVLALLLPWGGIWLPLSDRAETLRGEVAEARAQQAWMAAAAERVRQAGGATAVPGEGRAGSLLGRVDRSAGDYGLGERLERLQPDGDQRVRVWLERADFDQMLYWLDALAETGVRVHALSLEPLDAPGRVNARLTLESES